MSGYLTAEQVAVLLAPIRPARVSKMTTGGRSQSYVEGYELRAHLNRVFGFGRWSSDVTDQRLLYEDKRDDGKWMACYSSLLRLTVCAPDGTVLATYTEGATGDCMGYQPSRSDALDLALKASETNALKRACTNLGDQFGLSLYRKGSLDPLVRQLVNVSPAVEGTVTVNDPTAHITETLPPEDETVEPEPDPYERTAPPEADWKPAPEPEGEQPEPVDWAAVVLADPPAGERPAAHFARLMMRATKAGAQHTVIEVDGGQLTVGALINRRLAETKVKRVAS